MSRAYDSNERAELKKIRERRAKDEKDSKVCRNINCAELGNRQPIEHFYIRQGKADSYCRLCRKEMARARKEHAEFLPQTPNVPKMRKFAPKKQTLNIGKAPWCKIHKTNSKNCGDAEGRFFKDKKHRAKISKAMMGKKNALGNHVKRGPMSAEWKLKISMKVKETLRRKRENGNGRGG